jgi:peptidyl-prolyl cis-trans isomerase SurA
MLKRAPESSGWVYAITAVLVIAGAWAVGRAEVLEQVLVKVNGDIITKTEFEARQVAAVRQRNQQLSDADLKKEVEAVTPQLLVDMIDELLILQRGKELGYKLTEEQFKGVLENIKKENKLETEDQFQAALKQEDMTMVDLRKMLETQAVVSRVEQSEVFSRINITESEERLYYEEHGKEFTTPAEVTLRELLVSVPTDATKGLSVGLDEEAKQKAAGARARAAAGESFEGLVAEFSDAPSKANGGLVGPLHPEELAPELVAVIKELKVGGVSEVVRTARGYQCFKLESLSDVKLLPFEESRQQIGDRLFNTHRAEEFQKFIVKLRSSAIIEWKNAELRKLYEQKIGAPAQVASD